MTTNRIASLVTHTLLVCVVGAIMYWWVVVGTSIRTVSVLGVVANYAGAIYFFQRARFRLRNWRTAKGKIVAMEGDSDGQTPVVRFTSGDGDQHEFRHYMAMNSYYVGLRVSVLHDPNQPEKGQINDWTSLWAMTVIGIGAGTFFAIFACGLVNFE